MSIVTCICGVVCLLLCAHMKSNLPPSAEGLDVKTVESLLELTKSLVCSAIPWLSIYMIVLSIAMWFVACKSRKWNGEIVSLRAKSPLLNIDPNQPRHCYFNAFWPPFPCHHPSHESLRNSRRTEACPWRPNHGFGHGNDRGEKVISVCPTAGAKTLRIHNFTAAW